LQNQPFLIAQELESADRIIGHAAPPPRRSRHQGSRCLDRFHLLPPHHPRPSRHLLSNCLSAIVDSNPSTSTYAEHGSFHRPIRFRESSEPPRHTDRAVHGPDPKEEPVDNIKHESYSIQILTVSSCYSHSGTPTGPSAL
jgi:hypothetical protein